jgi:hypothetical protein
VCPVLSDVVGTSWFGSLISMSVTSRSRYARKIFSRVVVVAVQLWYMLFYIVPCFPGAVWW